jgi:hypothetical protein
MKTLHFKILISLFIIICTLLTTSCSYNNTREDIIKYDNKYHAITEWDKLNALQQNISDNLALNTLDIYLLEKLLINLVETRDKIIEKLNIMQVPDVLKIFHETKLKQLNYRNQADTLLLEDFRENLLTNDYDSEKSKQAFDKIKEFRDKSEDYFLQSEKIKKEIYTKYGLDDILLQESSVTTASI